jgi:hypothetical protein
MMIPLNAQVLHTPVVRQQDLTTDLHILPRIPNLANLMTLMRGSQKLNARIGPSVQRLNTQQSRPQKLNCRRWALSYPDLVALLAKEAPTLDPRLVEIVVRDGVVHFLGVPQWMARKIIVIATYSRAAIMFPHPSGNGLSTIRTVHRWNLKFAISILHKIRSYLINKVITNLA